MRTFFIVGLPRSRTAWLANLLTYGDSFCFHEALAQVSSPQELPALFHSKAFPRGWYREVVGDADPSVPMFHVEIAELFPEAKYVFIERPYDEALASYLTFIRDNPLANGPAQTRNEATAGFRLLADRLAEMKNAVHGRGPLQLEFNALDRIECVQQLCSYCQVGLDHDRWQMLRNFRVNMIPRNVEKSLNVENMVKMVAAAHLLPPVTSKMTVLQSQFQEALRAMCGPNQAAWHWLYQWLEVTITWDHIVDSDVIDKEMADRAFESLLIDWTLNPFWQKYKELLTPVLANVISAWKGSNEPYSRDTNVKAWDAYTEIPCAVAFLLGGQSGVARTMPEIRRLVHLMRLEDAAKDAANESQRK